MKVNLFDHIKEYFFRIIKSRLFVVAILFTITSFILINRVFYLQIVKGQDYLDNYKLKIKKTRDVQGTRGKVYDRNGNVLADNELAYSVTIEDTGSYESIAEKNKSMNTMAAKIIDIVESNGDSVINDFGVILDSNSVYQYTMEGTKRLRFLADIFGYKTIDQLTNEQREYTAEDLINYLCTDKKVGYGIDQKKQDPLRVLKIVNLRYAISLNKFQKYIPTTVASGVSTETAAEIMENLDKLQGTNIQETSLRNYIDGKYFSSLLGYTGKISQEEYDTLSVDNKEYSLQDLVGKAGLEQTLDGTLQGKKGKETVYVDNLGKVVETEKGKESSAGNDVTLTIDKDLQIATYHIIEEKLAAILLSKIQNTMDYAPDPEGDADNIIIPISDVYNAFIGNEILDTSHFSSADAKAVEQQVFADYTATQATVLADIATQLQSADSEPYKALSKEMQTYMDYIVTDVLTNATGILIKDKIDTTDETYIAWTGDESINLYAYLNYAISKNWVDTSKLKDYVKEGKYSESGDVYQGIINFLSEYLKTNKGFDKLIYKYMIQDGSLSGTQICMMLYEQNVLEYDEEQYNSLAAGASAYEFIRNKISTLAITPGQLALEPCTASAVITNPNNGEVLAMVSYPGYDNNRLANIMDSNYYNKLLTDLSSPLYNNATQEKTAPGSTYKMVSSIAGLTEGTINSNTTFPCTGIFERVTPSPKCWIYPGAHGGLSVVGALQNSCNDFYYELGYQMSMVKDTQTLEDEYQSDIGLDKERKYAAMFGLGEKSGVEIEETSPQISDKDSVRSAIGQGTHNYTTSQLARYVSTVANGGSLYKLTLLQKSQDVNGTLVKDYTADKDATKVNLTDISSTSFGLVQSGMKGMVANSKTFNILRTEDMTMSGKTGTAQQSKVHPNHALFVGYAPSESPEISLSVRITNGYSSNFTSEIARDVVRYYFNLTDKSNLITGHAAELGAATRTD